VALVERSVPGSIPAAVVGDEQDPANRLTAWSIENALQPAHMLTTSGIRKPPSKGRLPSWLVHGKVVFAPEVCHIGIQERGIAVNSGPTGPLIRRHVIVRIHPGRRVRNAPPKKAVVPAEHDLPISKQRPGFFHGPRKRLG